MCCALTLGHFSAYNRPSLLSLFLQVIQRPATSSGFSSASPLSLQEILLTFVLKRQRAPFLKAVMTSASPAARPATGEPITPTYTSLPDQPTNRSKVFQVKTAVLLGSSSSIAATKAVKETLEGISDVNGPAFQKCFEFENSPNSIQSVKGRLKAHFSFWVHALGLNDFILRVSDNGYAIPFITFPQNAFFDNHSALMHAGFVLEAIHELILSGLFAIVQLSSPPHVVNPLSVSILQSCGKKRLILDLGHVNKHIWKEKFKFEDSRNACVIFLSIISCLNLI